MFSAQKAVVRLVVLSLLPYIDWLIEQNERIWIIKSFSLFSFLRTTANTHVE